jgi:EmrB/QacA subfamily drug resistance transporter
VLGVLCLSLVLIVANNSSLNVDLPVLQRTFDASTSSLQWLVDAYSLVFAGLLLPAGALADRYGRKTALQLGLVVFGVASLAALLAAAPWQLMVLRAVMGAGAAFIMPGTLSILTNVFPPAERPKAIAIWAGFAGLGGVLGPLASGYLLDHFYWGSAFFVNLPIIVVALAVGLWIVPNSRDPADTVLDPPGAVLAIAGLSVLLYGIIDGPERGWFDPVVVGALAAGALLISAFAWWELRTPQPMLDIRLFAHRSMAVGSGTIVLQYFALFGLFFSFLQYLQLAHGYTPLQAAAAELPIGILLMIGAPLSARLVQRHGPRAVVGSGLLVTATGLATLSFSRPSTSLWLLVVAQALIGLGVGQTTAPSTTLIMSSVRLSKSGVGSAVNDTSRELGGALGIAVLGSIVNSVYRGRIRSRLPRLPGWAAADAHRSVTDAFTAAARLRGADAAQVVRAARVTFSEAFGAAMWGAAAMCALCSALVWAFQRRASS